MQKQNNTNKGEDTSWQNVAGWYDTLLETDSDTYQSKVVLPNLLRLINIQKDEKVLDVACGQGFFSRAFSAAGAQVVGADLSKDLIDKAIEHSKGSIAFYVAPAHDMSMLGRASFDKATIVLALQNIKNASEALVEISRLLKPGGSLYVVLNHPVLRIPKHSGWEFDEVAKKQYRKIDAYMSEIEVPIDMNPSKRGTTETFSFHRPLQWYFKAFSKAGFSVTKLEEWISHKQSQKGPRQLEEDRMRKEVPLFMCVEVKKN